MFALSVQKMGSPLTSSVFYIPQIVKVFDPSQDSDACGRGLFKSSLNGHSSGCARPRSNLPDQM